jgi:hypothetical protein
MLADSIFFYAAIIGTAIFAIKFILLLIGIDGESSDIDSDEQFSLFSIQTISSFLMGAGWMGLASLHQFGFGEFISLILAIIIGIIFVLTITLSMGSIKKLDQINQTSLFDIVGKSGTVYLSIPKDAYGQVQIEFNGALQTFDATAHDKIDSFKKVEVIDIRDEKILLVRELKM